MNRAKIKNDAKKMIEGNLWTILKPMLIVMVVLGFVNVISEKVLQDTFAGTMCSTLLSLAVMPLSYGLDVFILKYVRKEQVDYDEIFKHYSKFVPIFLPASFATSPTLIPDFTFSIVVGTVSNATSRIVSPNIFAVLLAIPLPMFAPRIFEPAEIAPLSNKY